MMLINIDTNMVFIKNKIKLMTHFLDNYLIKIVKLYIYNYK